MSIGGIDERKKMARFDIGQKIARIGNKLGLPEFGISEKVGGYNDTYDYLPGRLESGSQAAEPQTPTDEVGSGYTMTDIYQRGTPEETAGTQYEPNIVVTPWDMQKFDLNNPQDLARYIQSTDQYYNGVLSSFEQNQASLRDIDIEQAVADEARAQRDIDEALTILGEKETQYGKDYVRSVADLAEGFRQGSARRQAFYASVAPRVYQSSQGSSQQYAENKWKEGQTRLEEDKMRAEREFGRARTGYMQNKQDLSNQLNLYKRQRQTEFEDTLSSKRQEIAGARAGLAQVDATARASANKFKAMPTYTPGNLDYSPSQVNLNDLMGFIKFQPVGAQTSGLSSTKTQSIATPESGGASLQNYMGYNTKQEEEPINLYKQGYGF
jgi:hypothetical protein